ncbi:MAG: NAD(P)-dependent oxidoreductase [Candidatus Micrarchaeota archaeon]|nr:NAD(P)-dependent oxidoreductase [Candidatus Micrarchaeota archaeon]
MAEERKTHSSRRVSLVTGATSTLGVEVVRRLMKRGDEVRVVIRQHPEHNQEWKGLPSGVKPYVADLSFPSADTFKILREACEGVNTIFHFASANRPTTRKFSKYVEINVIGTENLLRAFMESNPSDAHVHVIYSSSTAVYGYNRPGETLTEDSRTAPVTPYGESKLMGEHVIKAFASANKRVGYTIFRIGIMYGGSYDVSFNKVFRMLKEGRMKIIGDGGNHLCLVNVNDAAEAIVMASESPKSRNKTYNMTDGVKYTQKELIGLASKFLGLDMPKGKISKFLVKMMTVGRSFDDAQLQFLLSDRIVSVERAKKELGFRPKRSIEIEGKSMVNAFLKGHGATMAIEE